MDKESSPLADAFSLRLGNHLKTIQLNFGWHGGLVVELSIDDG